MRSLAIYNLQKEVFAYNLPFPKSSLVGVFANGVEHRYQDVRRASNTPFYYFVGTTGFAIYPTPTEDVTGGLTLFYNKYPTQLSVSTLTAVPELDTDFHMLLVYGTLVQIAENFNDVAMVNNYTAKYNGLIEEFNKVNDETPDYLVIEDVMGGVVMSSQGDIAQQFIDGGVVPADLVGQETVSKTYVDGQIDIQDASIAIIASQAATAQSTANNGVAAAATAQSTANTAVGAAASAQTAANTAQNTVDLHKISTIAHSAANITYNGSVEGASNTKQAIDLVKQRVDTIVAGAGESNTEILDARQPATGAPYPILGARLNNVDAKLADTENTQRN